LKEGDGFGGAPRLRPGESVGDLLQRERAMAMRIAKAEASADTIGRDPMEKNQ
jgi:magnesium transporter